MAVATLCSASCCAVGVDGGLPARALAALSWGAYMILAVAWYILVCRDEKKNAAAPAATTMRR